MQLKRGLSHKVLSIIQVLLLHVLIACEEALEMVRKKTKQTTNKQALYPHWFPKELIHPCNEGGKSRCIKGYFGIIDPTNAITVGTSCSARLDSFHFWPVASAALRGRANSRDTTEDEPSCFCIGVLFQRPAPRHLE